MLLLRIIKQVAGYGKLRSQRAFRKLYLFAIHGMNYDRPHLSENGELVAMHYVCEQLDRSRRPVVFDGGANVGDWTINFLREFKGDAVVHAFEPARKTFETLVQRTAQITINAHCFGLGDKEGTVELFNADPGSTIASMYPLPTDHPWGSDSRETISIRTIDRFCEQESIQAIDFLKLDLEGHELSALRGAEKMISSGAIRFIQFEFGNRNVDSRTYFRDFFNMLSGQYRIMRIVENGLYPILQYGEEHEIFVGVCNYLAERVPRAVPAIAD